MIGRNLVRLIMMTALSFLAAAPSFGHKGESHENQEPAKALDPSSAEALILQKINDEYLSKVKPIFNQSCMNCHGSNTKYPWYHSLPFAKKIIDYDVTEAKVHLDMTNDYPFGGHGSPSEDLEAILASLEKDTIPPLRYKMMHWSSRLTSEEVTTVKNWIKSGLEELETIKEKNKEE